jgi:hypothetical protein
MFTLRSRQARLSVRMALTGMLLLLSLVGPAPGLAYSAPALSGDVDGGGGSAFADLPSEPAKLEGIAPSPGPGMAHVPTIDMGIADTGLATTLDVLQDPITPTLQFSSSTYSVDEDAGPALITVTLVPTSTDPVTVTYAIVPGTATPVDDYTGTGGTLSFAPDDGTETISVPITNDLLDELGETLSITLSHPISAELGTPYTATLTIVDDDPQPTVQFQSASYGVNEVTSPALLTATLSAPSGLTVTVSYDMSGGTATANEDFADEIGSITFAPGDTTQAVGVRIVDDVYDEDDETLSVGLTSASHATVVAPSTATVTIADDDDPPTVGFDSSSYSVDEGAGQATITVTLSAPSSREITAHYATSNGTATAGSDYTARSGTLTFDPVDVTVDAVLEHEFATSAWSPPSPDPAGVAYISHLNRLMISDSEVEEIEELWAGANVFVAELSGVLSDTFSTTNFQPISSTEPTGVAYNPVNRHLFFSDDNRGRVFEVDPGDDGAYGTSDDSISRFRTTALGSYDPEGITYDTWRGYLFLSDGNNEEVYEISPGDNGIFDGVPGFGDDEMTQFDTDRLNVHNPEGVEFDPYTGHLYVLGGGSDPIAETTTAGKLIRYINISALSAHNPGSLAYAPSSTDPSEWHLYIVERGYDNTPSHPHENDGKAYEISFPTGETTFTFTVPITDDIIAEGSETVNLALTSPVNATLGQDTATLTIVDEFSGVQFSDAAYDVNEGAGSATITVTLDTPSALTVNVDYAVTGGSATAGSDYILANGTLTFTPGTVDRTFTVTLIDDNVDELAQETIDLELSNPSNAELGTPTSTVLRIEDNDPQPTVSFAPPAYAQDEDAENEIVGVELSRPSAFTVTVHYATSDGTATAGSDYVAASGILTFAPGTTAQSFPVSIIDDPLAEPSETVNLTLSGASNAVVGTPTTTLTIYDDEAPPTVQFSSSSYSIGEGEGTATITVTLSVSSAQSITVHYATSDGTATAGSDYTGKSGTLSFAAGQTTRTFTVSITDDGIDEPSETVSLALTSPSNATLGTPSTATLAINDNDGQPTVEFGDTSYSAGEGAGQATISVRLSNPSASTVSVHYATSGGTASAGTDYQAASGTVTFAPGVTEQSVNVTIIDDLLDEEDETVGLALSSPTNATLGVPSSATLTIVDNDDQPDVQFSASAYSVDESAGSATITVTLSAASSKTITVDYATSDGTAVAGSDYVTKTGTLTFDPGETVQTFTVVIIDDMLNEDDETVGLALSNPSNATPGSPSSATLTIVEGVLRVYLPVIFRNQ